MQIHFSKLLIITKINFVVSKLFIIFAAMQITLKEYLENKELNTDDLSMSAITKRIREKRSLPNVKKVIELHRFYLLEVIIKKNKRVAG